MVTLERRLRSLQTNFKELRCRNGESTTFPQCALGFISGFVCFIILCVG